MKSFVIQTANMLGCLLVLFAMALAVRVWSLPAPPPASACPVPAVAYYDFRYEPAWYLTPHRPYLVVYRVPCVLEGIADRVVCGLLASDRGTHDATYP